MSGSNTPPTSGDNGRDELLAKQAFEHYATRLGSSPSPNALYIYYVKYAREHPDDTAWIPSRSRNKIYDWHRDYEWALKYEQRILGQLEADKKRYEEMRARGQDQLSLLIEDAVLAAHKLINSTDEKIKLAAMKEIFDRTGLISHDKLPKKDRKDKDGDNRLPPANASEEEMTRWLLDQRREA